jgi:hypothetical protein
MIPDLVEDPTDDQLWKDQEYVRCDGSIELKNIQSLNL